jgi:hypothetical protein
MQVLYQILQETGYISSKRGFADLLNIHHGNIYAYLADPVHRAAGEDKGTRIAARVATLHSWIWCIENATGLKLEIWLRSDKDLMVSVTGGTDANGNSVAQKAYATTYAEYDFIEPPGWETIDNARRLHDYHVWKSELTKGKTQQSHKVNAARLAHRIAELEEKA